MLHHAVFCGPKETIEFLIESRHKFGINLEERTSGGLTILHFACWQRDISIVNFVHNQLEKFNIDIDFDTLNLDSNYGQVTPIHYACANKTFNFISMSL